MLNQIDQEKAESPKKSDLSQFQKASDISSRQDQSLHFGANSNNLPRWAQSVVSPMEPQKTEANKSFNDDSTDMSRIFEQNLKQMGH
jgi:hypothetical protein